jgi:hypothetical protein
MRKLSSEELDILKSQLIQGISELHEQAHDCESKNSDSGSHSRERLADISIKEVEKLRAREEQLRGENEKLKHVLEVYNKRRRSDRESVERWMAHAKELETLNQQLMEDLKKLQEKVLKGVGASSPTLPPRSSQLGLCLSQIPTDSTCDEDGLPPEVDIKQEPTSQVDVKIEPHSSPDYSKYSQLPPHLVPDSLDLEAPLFPVAPSEGLMTNSRIASDLSSNNLTSSDTATPVVPSRRPGRPNFTHEIDEDLRSGKRRVMFETTDVQLRTPKTTSAQRRITESWLKKGSLDESRFNTPSKDETPVRHRLDGQSETMATGAIDFNVTNKEDFISRYESILLCESFTALLTRLKLETWHPHDFVINPNYNDNLNFAFKETTRGSRRQCEHGYDCTDCSKVCCCY